MPAGIDLLLSKAKPHSDDSKSSGITCLRRKKSYCANPIATRGEEWEHVSRRTQQDPRSVQKEGRRCCMSQSWDFPAASGEDHGKAAVPLQPREVSGAEMHVQPMEEPHSGTGLKKQLWSWGKPGATLGRACRTAKRENHAGADFLVGILATLRTSTGAAFSWRTVVHEKDSHWRNLWRTVSHKMDPILRQVKSPVPEEEAEAETTCDEQTVTPLPVSMHHVVEEGRGSGIKSGWGRRRGELKVLILLRFFFTSHYTGLILTGNKFN